MLNGDNKEGEGPKLRCQTAHRLSALRHEQAAVAPLRNVKCMSTYNKHKVCVFIGKTSLFRISRTPQLLEHKHFYFLLASRQLPPAEGVRVYTCAVNATECKRRFYLSSTQKWQPTVIFGQEPF